METITNPVPHSRHRLVVADPKPTNPFIAIHKNCKTSGPKVENEISNIVHAQFSFHLTVFVLQETWWCHFYFQHKGVIVKKMAIGCGGVWCKVLQFLITECCCQQSVVHSHKKRNNLKWLRTRKGEGRGGGRGGWNEEGTWVNLDKGRGPQEVCVCTAALSLKSLVFYRRPSEVSFIFEHKLQIHYFTHVTCSCCCLSSSNSSAWVSSLLLSSWTSSVFALRESSSSSICLRSLLLSWTQN